MEEIKVGVAVSEQDVIDCIECAAIRYWCSEASWGHDPADPFAGTYTEGETGKTFEVTRAKVIAAVEKMLTPEIGGGRHGVALITGEFDAETGDVLVQVACFGEVVYG